MVKAFDTSKFTKSITKSIENISVGFRDPKVWVSTGSMALNFLISGRFDRGIPLGKVTMFSGESGAGKSFIVSGNLVRDAQRQGIFVVMIDTERALDEDWLQALGVDTSPDRLLKANLAMVDDVAKFLSEYMKWYKDTMGPLPEADRQKVLFIVDSLGMLLTPTDVNQFEAGEMKGDMGRKAKSLTALVRNLVNLIGAWDVGLVCTNHSYASQDPYSPDPKISGGDGPVYAASIVVAMKKLKLKEDEDGNKVSEVLGIRAGCKVMKSRYNQPFTDIELQIPYETGMDPLTGLFDLFEKKKLVEKEGNRYKYIDLAGNEHKYFRKEWRKNTAGIMDLVMNEFDQKMSMANLAAKVEESPENTRVEDIDDATSDVVELAQVEKSRKSKVKETE